MPKRLHFSQWNSLPMVFILSLLSVLNVHAQELDFNQREISVIHLRAMEVLQDYESIINQLGEAIVHNPSITKGLREQFLELFSSPEVRLFNDLDPAYNLSEFFEAETYINNLELSYPDGISIDLYLDNARVGDILSHGNDRYTLDFQLAKQIQGNYMNQKFNTNRENLLFRIGFTETGNEFMNFKLVGIRSPGSVLVPNDEQSIEELNSQRMKQSENDAIKQGIEFLVNDYSNYLALMGSDDETDYDKDQYARSFKALFESPDISIYNDISPSQTRDFISIDEYLEFLRIHYPAGITDMSITIDSIMFHNVIVEEKKGYSVIIDLDKFFSGVYDNQKLFRSMISLTIKISFQKDGKVFKSFRIRSINPEAESIIESDMTFSMPVQEINPVTRKGLALLIFGSYGQTRIEDHNLLDMNMEENNHIWSYSPGYGVNLGVGILVSFNDHIALETGGFFNQYVTTFSIDGDFKDIYFSYDANDHSFKKSIQAKYDSIVTYNLISLPLTFTYTSSKPGKTGIYISVGGLFSYCFSGTYNASGSWRYYGYYPDHPKVIRNLDIEELGYYNHNDIEESGTLEGGQLNFSLRASMGLSIPIKYFTQIRLGPEVEWGLYDFNIDGGEATDIFGNTMVHQPTYLFRFGVKLGLVFKL